MSASLSTVQRGASARAKYPDRQRIPLPLLTFRIDGPYGSGCARSLTPNGKSSSVKRSQALLALARLLREQAPTLQKANALDLSQARESGLEGPMVDRLKLSAQALETVALGCG